MLPFSSIFSRSKHRLLCNSVSVSLHRFFSASRDAPLELSLSHPVYMIWGSNTGVGKTLVSTGLADSVLSCSSASVEPIRFNYVKPVQTGFPVDSDSRFVHRKVSEIFIHRKPKINLFASNRALKGSSPALKQVLGAETEDKSVDGSDNAGLRDFNWHEESLIKGEKSVSRSCELDCKTIFSWKDAISPHLAVEREGAAVEDSSLLDSLQRCLRLSYGDRDNVRKGDWTIIETAGGVASPGPSGTLQCDLYRPFRLPAILVGDGRLGGISGTISAYESLTLRGYDVVAVILEGSGFTNEVALMSYLQKRVGIMLLFSSLMHVLAGGLRGLMLLYRWFQVELARDMGYAAARFGHVMFPENVYEPALKCAELLLEGVGRGWASRTYFSDNGSTAIEIALKMAFRKFALDHGILLNFQKRNMFGRSYDFKVLALNGSYHGDTLGAMEAQAPSSYTGFLQQPWYSGRGLFLDPPTVFICDEQWHLSLPKVLQSEELKPEDMTFSSHDELLFGNRDHSDLARYYSAFIVQQLSSFSTLGRSTHIGALIIEPVIQAAGGMHMIDPLFQRVLVKECQSQKIPVIFDEVFTGFWRLGAESAAEILGCLPDIACFGKLMTGGVIPLAATLATDAIYNAFKGDSKLVALLHGHSYSAHAMGCTAATKAIQWFKDPQTNYNINVNGRQLRELWDLELVHKISSHSAVQRVVALGTLFAMELRAEGSDVGYGSLYVSSLVQKLREDGIYTMPLGNVIYLMCGPCTPPNVCSRLLRKLYRQLHEFSQSKCAEVRSVEV